jgi:D-alanine transaminase
VSRDRRIVTRPLSNAVLPGVTRGAVLRLAERHRLKFEQRAFSVAEACAAAEAFYTSASTLVMPVVSIDGKRVGDGRPGPLTAELRQLYLDMAVA